MERLTICKIEGKAKCFICLVLGKTQYFLFFFPVLSKRKWYYNIFRQKATRTFKLIITVAWKHVASLICTALLIDGGNLPHLPSWHFLRTLPSSSSPFSSLTVHLISPRMQLRLLPSASSSSSALATLSRPRPTPGAFPTQVHRTTADMQEENTRTFIHMSFLSLKIRKLY